MCVIRTKKALGSLKRYDMERRGFFKTGARLLMLGGFAAASGYLVWQGRVTRSQAVCGTGSVCNGCSKLSDCSDDQAIAYRNTKE